MPGRTLDRASRPWAPWKPAPREVVLARQPSPSQQMSPRLPTRRTAVDVLILLAELDHGVAVEHFSASRTTVH